VALALVRVLEQIYEADFLESSYGYRPERTQHQALDQLGRTIQQCRKLHSRADIKASMTSQSGVVTEVPGAPHR